MNSRKYEIMLHKLELQMRRAEVRGDALLVAHYSELIADLMDMQNDQPHIGSENNSFEGKKGY